MIRLSIFAALLLVCASCSDDDTNGNEDQSSYLPLKTGNYWVYQVDRVAPDGTVTATDQLDSIHILSNTFSEGVEYHSVLYDLTTVVPEDRIKLVRDSAGYLITSDNEVLFSPSTAGTIIDTYQEFKPDGELLYAVDRKMQDLDQPTVTPAGTFTTSNAAGHITYGPSLDSDCTNIQNRKYAKGIGLVETTDFFVNSCTDIRARLLRYNIED